MTTKSFLECERKGLDKMKKYQLPHKYRKIGIGIFVISFIAMFIVAFTSTNLELKQVTKYGILVGLLIASISKEKIEDELVRNLRMQSYTFAFIFGVIITITNPLFNFIANLIFEKQQANFSGVGDWQILWILLSVQFFYFEYLKKMHK
jgi:hypothetical protein